MELKDVVMTCGACPSQWEAKTEDNRDVYIRYRWGTLSITVSKPDGGAFDDDSRCVFSEQLGDGMDGCIGYDEIEPIIKNIDLEKAFESETSFSVGQRNQAIRECVRELVRSTNER